DIAEAEKMLRSHALSGGNDVVSGVALVCLDESVELTGSDVTTVRFKPYDPALVKKYAATKDPLDKAGGYGIQSGAGELIGHIEGRYDTVVGFPTRVVSDLLQRVGITSRPVELTLPVRQKRR
ncbi:MAG TPA: Maf family protein, partial [Candidatus Saccharimonadales bacterium]|nr:Maf family protein [Candidatus Saccharimonadales bacterium]